MAFSGGRTSNRDFRLLAKFLKDLVAQGYRPASQIKLTNGRDTFSITGKGYLENEEVVRTVRAYRVYIKLDATKRVLSSKVDHKWRTFGPYYLYHYTSTQKQIVTKTAYKTSYSRGGEFYDEGLEETLGGNEELLGGGIK